MINIQLVLFALILSGCSSVVLYTPKAENVQMGEVQAKRILDQSYIKIIGNKDVKFSKLRRAGSMTPGSRPDITLPLKDLNVSSGYYSDLDGAFDVIILPDAGEDRIRVGTNHPLAKVAEALYVISMKAKREGYAPQEAIEEARFEQTLKTYLSANPKPSLSEEARSFKVRADNAVRNKLPSEAADFYGEALRIDPWWPEGHFNRGLILAEIEMFNDAIFEMKRYLKLVPNATNARAVQDKIYILQGEEDRKHK